MFYKTEDLLDSIKIRTLAPSSQQTFSDLDLIKLANEEMQLSLVPDIISVREDFFLNSKDISVTASLNHYRLPERAIGNALKDLYYVDSNSNKYEVVRGDISDFATFTSQSGLPGKFILQGDEIVLIPTPNVSSGMLDAWFYERPNKLVPTTSVAKITAVSSLAGTTTFTVDTDLSATLVVGSNVDFLSLISPFMLWAQDAVITAITSSTIEVSTASVSNEVSAVLPQINDYVCPAQSTNIPQVPQEAHPLLAQMVAARLMEALGDLQKLQAVNQKLMEMRRQFFQMIMNRVESQPQRIIKPSGILGALGAVRFSGRWG